jgi:hypothetical protein
MIFGGIDYICVFVVQERGLCEIKPDTVSDTVSTDISSRVAVNALRNICMKETTISLIERIMRSSDPAAHHLY